MRFSTLILFFLLSVQPCFATDQVSLVAERDLPTGKEQIALIFESNQTAILTLNSNFFDPSSAAAKLGHFTSPMNEKLNVEYQEFKQILVRLDRQKTLPLQKRKTTNPPIKCGFFWADMK